MKLKYTKISYWNYKTLNWNIINIKLKHNKISNWNILKYQIET